MQMSRRRFLALTATVTLAACSSDDDASDATDPPPATDPPDPTTTATDPTTTSSTVGTTTTSTEAPEPDPEPEAALSADPFVFGVGSGDPDASSVVLWTRLDGDLLDEEVGDGGIDVAWTFEPDDGGDVITGTESTDRSLGWTVHAVAEIPGAGAFRFSVPGWESAGGRTAPVDPTATEFRLATASCQNYQSGFYAAHRDIAAWSPDLVVFLGDFIYEGPATELGDGVVRTTDPGEPVDVEGYRARYATYLSDPQLQASRAAAPWLVIWDDHEVDNDYAADNSQDEDDPAEFAERRLQAYRVWWENTPTRLPSPDLAADPTEPYPIHRGLDVGELLRISALDGRQFRDDQLSEVILDVGPPVEGWDDPGRTMLGAEQEAWLEEQFASSTATWNCMAQQTVFSDTRLGEVGAILNYDQWDGYAAARDRILAVTPSNFVTLTGDIHLAGVGQTMRTDGTPAGVEFVTTAISSTPNVDPALVAVVTSIPAIVDAELEFRGYTRHTVTSDTWTAEYRQVVDIADPDAEVRTWKQFQVTAGDPTVAELV